MYFITVEIRLQAYVINSQYSALGEATDGIQYWAPESQIKIGGMEMVCVLMFIYFCTYWKRGRGRRIIQHG